MSIFLTEALSLAGQGYHVFPLRPSTKDSPLIAQWQKLASTDPEQIRAWWAATPDANIGVACGLSNIIAIDVDAYKNPSLDFTLPATRTIATPQGGYHLLYQAPDFHVSNRDLATAVDVRGSGGYVVAPPSVRPEGTYTLYRDLPVAPLDAILYSRLKERQQPKHIAGPSASFDKIDLTGEAAEFVNNWVAKYVTARRDRVIRAINLGYEGETWDSVAFGVARDFVRIAQTSWVPFTLDDAEAAYLELMELFTAADRTWDNRQYDKWYRAVHEVFDAFPQPERLNEILLSQASSPTPQKWSQDFFGLSDRMRAYYPSRIVWLTDIKAWATYTGRWKLDNGESAGALGRRLVEIMVVTEGGLYSPIDLGNGTSELSEFRSFVAKLRDPGKLSKILEQIKFDNHDLSDNFDTDTNLLGLQNGAFDLTTLKLMEYSPDMRITRYCNIEFDPDASCPRWLSFLEQIQPDPDTRAYLARAIAYSFLGRANQKRVFILHGKKDTGKTTLLKTIEFLMGDHAIKLNSRAIYEKVRGDQSYDIDQAKGKRLVYVSEPTKHNVLDASTVKDFSGNGTMNSRTLYKAGESWKPIGILWIDANELPAVDPEEKQIWGRLKVIKFPVQFSDDPTTPPELRIDRSLDETLRAEASGIFNWVISELAAYHAAGDVKFVEPKEVVEASRRYEAEQDNVLEFIHEYHDDGHIEIKDDATMRQSEFFPAYQRWFKDSGLPIEQLLGKQAFNDRVAEIFPRKKSKTTEFTGIGWTPQQTPSFGSMHSSYNPTYLIGD